MHQQVAQIDVQLAKLKAIESKVDACIMHLRTELGAEYAQLSTSHDFSQEPDELLTRKHRTKVGLVAIQLEKLLLELDGVDTLGGLGDVRVPRKQVVVKIQSALAEVENLLTLAQELIGKQDKVVKEEEEPSSVEEEPSSVEEEPSSVEEKEEKDETLPEVEIGENRFAYVLQIPVPSASRAEVNLSKHGQLTITLPDQTDKPLQYSIGYDVDFARCTIRRNSEFGLRIVLPKRLPQLATTEAVPLLQEPYFNNPTSSSSFSTYYRRRRRSGCVPHKALYPRTFLPSQPNLNCVQYGWVRVFLNRLGT
ncbi:hypothetical protein BASA81_003717 [Batrachochytrium salamandrivorans]|nr:hypothetical protein BASA81_003717 [Batrachochytrium salamandrivorans]